MLTCVYIYLYFFFFYTHGFSHFKQRLIHFMRIFNEQKSYHLVSIVWNNPSTRLGRRLISIPATQLITIFELRTTVRDYRITSSSSFSNKNNNDKHTLTDNTKRSVSSSHQIKQKTHSTQRLNNPKSPSFILLPIANTSHTVNLQQYSVYSSNTVYTKWIKTTCSTTPPIWILTI